MLTNIHKAYIKEGTETVPIYGTPGSQGNDREAEHYSG